ncbi:hypothetical protein P153DRAFT_362424 [Dothidotthia symphoricarpi CBS 119687]|uniref:N-acetyltransferase domain-containing protein n=1 Tax=Dothidotthia symphoricarpi CBS 119687 TaxID=1392245 RepID=A0A6A6ARW9_9PLEO|nr:uncharacterized protein P153DRAFT_362424 [Dothidotthia symphoricarpi CBS 119687]KAF2134679.1 hypothetical protein P153DRAFT_362424 [Dothidotthia symphoricarpi CBS 119687]
MPDLNLCISTPRLNVHFFDPSNDAHCDFVLELLDRPDPQVPDAAMDREGARAILKNDLEKVSKTGYGRYAISLKPSIASGDQNLDCSHDGVLVGLVSMQLNRFPGAPNIPDIGFGLLNRNYGKGYATEAAQGLLKYFEEERGQTEFAGYCQLENLKSNNVFRRLGFEERGVREVGGIVTETKLEVVVWTKNLERQLDEYGF